MKRTITITITDADAAAIWSDYWKPRGEGALSLEQLVEQALEQRAQEARDAAPEENQAALIDEFKQAHPNGH